MKRSLGGHRSGLDGWGAHGQELSGLHLRPQHRRARRPPHLRGWLVLRDSLEHDAVAPGERGGGGEASGGQPGIPQLALLLEGALLRGELVVSPFRPE